MTKSCHDSVARDLDLIRFIRSKRLHAFGMNLLLGKKDLKQIARMAFTRPIKEHHKSFEMQNYDSIEGIDRDEKLSISMFKHQIKPAEVKPPPPLRPKLDNVEPPAFTSLLSLRRAVVNKEPEQEDLTLCRMVTT